MARHNKWANHGQTAGGLAEALRHTEGGQVRLWNQGQRIRGSAEYEAEVAGHARIETTAIYTTAIGPEEQDIAKKMWE